MQFHWHILLPIVSFLTNHTWNEHYYLALAS